MEDRTKGIICVAVGTSMMCVGMFLMYLAWFR